MHWRLTCLCGPKSGSPALLLTVSASVWPLSLLQCPHPSPVGFTARCAAGFATLQLLTSLIAGAAHRRCWRARQPTARLNEPAGLPVDQFSSDISQPLRGWVGGIGTRLQSGHVHPVASCYDLPWVHDLYYLYGRRDAPTSTLYPLHCLYLSPGRRQVNLPVSRRLVVQPDGDSGTRSVYAGD
jgi:hypothetical protein